MVFPDRSDAAEEIQLFLGDSTGPSVRRVEGFGSCSPRLGEGNPLHTR